MLQIKCRNVAIFRSARARHEHLKIIISLFTCTLLHLACSLLAGLIGVCDFETIKAGDTLFPFNSWNLTPFQDEIQILNGKYFSPYLHTLYVFISKMAYFEICFYFLIFISVFGCIGLHWYSSCLYDQE